MALPRPVKPRPKAAPLQEKLPLSRPDAATELARALLERAPADASGAAERAAMQTLLALPEDRRAESLPEAFAIYERAQSARAANPAAASEALRAFVRERHAEAVLEPGLAALLTAPRSRAGVLAWLMGEQEGGRGARPRGEGSGEDSGLVLDAIRGPGPERLQALAELGLVTAGVTHDFNNLMQAVVGHVSLAREDSLKGSEQERSLDQALRAALYASELSRGLLAWAKASPTPAVPVQLSAVVEDVLRMLGPVVPPGVTVAQELAGDLPALHMDAIEIRRIVLNLVVNAIQAVADSPRREGKVIVRTGEDPGIVFVEVEDEGPGLTSDALHRVFEPFFSTREGGTGLGLSTVRRIVSSLGGSIQVSNEHGGGAKLRVSLPRPVGAA